jgi:ribosomal protein L21
MMSMIAFLLLTFASNASGFVAPRVPLASTSISTSRSKNKNAPLLVGYAPNIETEDDARFILSRAKQCAYDDDDTCSVEDCEIMLREMIHLQSGCVTGTLVGHDLCDEQDVAADVVAHLRAKVQQYIKDHRKPHHVAK